jgi:uncharacterized damage-inducible protein DinB
MAGKPLTTEQAMSMLAGAPGRIAEMAHGIDADVLQAAPQAGEWSANEVLAHIRACADVWGGSIERILAEDYPTLKAMDPRTWMRSTDYLQQAFHASLDAYTRQRAGLIEVLSALKEQEWTRSAKVVGAGKPLERTVFFYAQWMAIHERPHLKQIARVLGQ